MLYTFDLAFWSLLLAALPLVSSAATLRLPTRTRYVPEHQITPRQITTAPAWLPTAFPEVCTGSCSSCLSYKSAFVLTAPDSGDELGYSRFCGGLYECGLDIAETSSLGAYESWVSKQCGVHYTPFVSFYSYIPDSYMPSCATAGASEMWVQPAWRKCLVSAYWREMCTCDYMWQLAERCTQSEQSSSFSEQVWYRQCFDRTYFYWCWREDDLWCSGVSSETMMYFTYEAEYQTKSPWRSGVDVSEVTISRSTSAAGASVEPSSVSESTTSTPPPATNMVEFLTSIYPSRAAPDCITAVESSGICSDVFTAASNCHTAPGSLETSTELTDRTACFCPQFLGEGCQVACNDKADPVSWFNYAMDMCGIDSANRSYTLNRRDDTANYEDVWTDYAFYEEEAYRALCPWSWEVKYDPAYDDRVVPGEKVAPPCPSRSEKLGSFAIVNVVTLASTNVRGGHGAVLMYAGALVWIVFVGGVFIQIIWSFFGLGTLARGLWSWLRKTTSGVPQRVDGVAREQRARIRVRFNEHLVEHAGPHIIAARDFVSKQFYLLAPDIANSRVKAISDPGDTSGSSQDEIRLPRGIEAGPIPLMEVLWDEVLVRMGLNKAAATRIRNVFLSMAIPFIGQWLFWTGFVDLAGDRYDGIRWFLMKISRRD
ncbi:hypothetical protein ABW19_dt0207041 [Dactylella cylindrospora]|nr:hypothetical protein ABW19_dt0207041 [Dactylella cylindrospora]